MSDDNKNDLSNNNGRVAVFRWDGTIPAWGLFTCVLTLGLMWATYSWSQLQDVKDRLTIRETTASEYRRKVDSLEVQQRDVSVLMSALKSDITVVKELMIRLEKRFDK